MTTLVYGVGINDRSIKGSLKGKHIKSYVLWSDMLRRVYSPTELMKCPTYIGCTVSYEFKHYHLFHDWCIKQIGYNIEGFTLDKDILIIGNKEYSESTCVFIPQCLNKLLTKRSRDRGAHPIGVTKKGNKFAAQCSKDSNNKLLGVYSTPELAFQAYKTFKEAYIKEQAELYKDSIDPRAYLALVNYEVHIDD